jgi:DNA modification methylase
MHIELWDISRIKPYPANPRVNDAAVAAVAASLKEFGFRQPLVVDADGMLVVGHTRWKAALHLGLTQVPVHVASELTPAQCKAYRIADNQTASIAEWDYELLPVELTDLKDMAFDLNLLGFDEDELEKLLGPEVKEGLTPPDEIPEPPDEAVTQPGDLWKLGEHFLLCGDSTKAEDVDRVMAGEQAALIATDPPYLVDYTGERPNDSGKDWTDTYREIDIKDAEGFFRSVFTNAKRVIAPHAAIYTWHAHRRCGVIQKVWADLGILDHQQIIWVKPAPVFGFVYYHFRHEPCMVGWVQGSKPPHDGQHEFTSVWEVDWKGKARVATEHPTSKPVELFARPIRKHTRKGDVCYEPFSGSGSQIVAAEQLGRRCRAIEITPTFCDVAVRRWEEFTGKKAERVPAD